MQGPAVAAVFCGASDRADTTLTVAGTCLSSTQDSWGSCHVMNTEYAACAGAISGAGRLLRVDQTRTSQHPAYKSRIEMLVEVRGQGVQSHRFCVPRAIAEFANHELLGVHGSCVVYMLYEVASRQAPPSGCPRMSC